MNFQIQLHCLPCSRVKLWTSSRLPKSQSELFEHAKGLAAGCDIEPSMPRMPPSQCDRVNVPAATPQQYWYRALYLPLIDQLIQELNDRLLTHHDLFLGQYLMPTQLGALSGDTKNQIYNTYNNIFDNRILRWKARWKLAKGDNIVSSELSTLDVCLKTGCSA